MPNLEIPLHSADDYIRATASVAWTKKMIHKAQEEVTYWRDRHDCALSRAELVRQEFVDGLDFGGEDDGIGIENRASCRDDQDEKGVARTAAKRARSTDTADTVRWRDKDGGM